MAGNSTHALVALTPMLEPRTSGTWCGMHPTNVSKTVLDLDHHVEDVPLRGTSCLRLARPVALIRQLGTPLTASLTRNEFNVHPLILIANDEKLDKRLEASKTYVKCEK